MIKILQMGDTHLGYQYGSDLRRQDYKDAFEESIEIAIDRNVDAIVHTGDFFDSPNPGIEVFNDGLDVLSMLDEEEIKFYGIVGNHERKMEKQWLDIYEKFDMAERLSKMPKTISKENTSVSLYGIDAIRGPWWDSKDLELDKAESDYNILAMHELLNPPVPEHIADYDIQEVLNRVGIDINLLMLGDYHEEKRTTVQNTRIAYSGSTEKTGLDESEQHQVLLHEISSEGIKIKRRALERTREFVEMPIHLSENDGFHKVKMEIENVNIETSNSKDPVLVIRLKGENSNVTPREIKEKYEKDFAIVRVIDNRSQIGNTIQEEDIEGENVIHQIDNKIKQKDFSNEILKIKDIAEDKDIAKTNVRDEVKSILKGDKNED